MLLHLLLAEFVASNPNIKSRHTERLLDTSIRHFATFLGREPYVSDLTDKNLAGYIRHRQRQAKAPATVEREAAKLMCLWRWAASCGLVQPPRITIAKTPPAEPMAFLKWEVRRLFREARRYPSPIAGVPGERLLTALLAVCWDTAERIGALCEVQRSDFQLTHWWRFTTGGWVTIRSRKNGGRPMVRRLRRSTAMQLERLFEVSPHKKPFGFVHRGTLYYHLERLLKQAGLPTSRKHKFHCLRKSHASYLHKAGGDATASLGHRDPHTTWTWYLDPKIVGTQNVLRKLFNPFGLVDRLLGWVGL